MRKIIYLIIAISISSCISQEKNLPEEFDFGITESGIYKNDFFEMEISFNPKWVIQDKQQMNNLVEAGSEAVTGSDRNLKALVQASKVNTAYLLTISKYEIGTPVEFNPSFMVIAENTKNAPGIKNGKDYLFHTKNFLEQSQVDYIFEKDIFEKKIGKSTFYVMKSTLEYMSITITQEYITTVTHGFSLSYVLSYASEDEKNELYEIVEKIKI